LTAAPRLRVFAAIELPAELARRLSETIAELSPRLPRQSLRWVRSEGVHLTLKFYGEVAPERVPELQQLLQTAAAAASPMSLAVGGLGVFPNPFRPRVLWTDMTGDLENLLALQQAVDQASAPLGFPPEARGFTPHLTLGRFKGSLRPPEREKLAAVVKDERFARLGEFTADSLSLMRSDLKPGGAVYTRLFAARLGSRNQ